VGEQLFDAFGHFSGGFVGEGHGQYGCGVDALVDHVGDASGDDVGLAAAGTGYYQEGAMDCGNRFPLLFVQLFKEVFHRGVECNRVGWLCHYGWGLGRGPCGAG